MTGWEMRTVMWDCPNGRYAADFKADAATLMAEGWEPFAVAPSVIANSLDGIWLEVHLRRPLVVGGGGAG